MILFSEKVTPTFTNSNLNIITVKDFSEVFFDVYELEINGKKYVTEKIDEYKGSPVVNLTVKNEGKEYTAPFVLNKGNFSILFNKNNSTYVRDVTESQEEIIIEDTIANEVDTIIFEKHEDILEDIKQAKSSARNYFKKLKEKQIQEASNINRQKLDEFNNELKQIQQGLVEEFIRIVSNVRSDISIDSNNTIQKNTNKALSRIGNVKIQLEEDIAKNVTSLQRDIDKASERIKVYYDEKLNKLNEAVSTLSGETKKECVKFISESRDSLLHKIGEIKTDVPNIIIERKNGTSKEIDLKQVKLELEKSITRKFSIELMSLKRMMEMISGGGSVAQQFANGGTMNGNLNIVGNILSGGINLIDIISHNSLAGDYLPLSGGTITGSLSVSGPINLNYGTFWYDVPYYYLDYNGEFPISGTTSVLSISTINSNVKDSLDKIDILQYLVEELSQQVSYNANTIQEGLSAEQAQIDSLNDRVNALYSYLIQNFDQNIVASSGSISQFVSNEWSSTMGLVPGSTVTLSAANLVYILGNSDGSSSSDYFEVNLKPNFLFYKTNLNNYAILDAFPLSAMKSSKYVLQVEDRTTGDIYYSELNIVANDSFAIASEYSSNYTTESPFVEFGAALVNQQVCLSAVAIIPSTMSNFIFKGNRTNFF